ncbi:MAG: hypothetical protein JW995_06270 [Melioribacteraceae bacterium]|nr:hypothetical protein [Melioribacteraceae bacterium]
MSYRITLNKPFPFNQTEKKLSTLSVKLFDYGTAKFFSYKDKFYELEEDSHRNIVGLTVHGNSAADFRSLMNIKDKIFAE